MTPDESFLQAIRAEPDDDALRLIYADFLQEKEDPASVQRGEFIRVQCELARMNSTPQRWLQLKTRAEALLTRNLESWVWPLRDLVGNCSREGWLRYHFRPSAASRYQRRCFEAL